LVDGHDGWRCGWGQCKEGSVENHNQGNRRMSDIGRPTLEMEGSFQIPSKSIDLDHSLDPKVEPNRRLKASQLTL
jgi:hypothetical protein